MKIQERIKIIAELSKSGIVTLVLISVFAGYLIGQPSESNLNITRMFLTLFGVLFLASGSSAWNQYQERALDAQMPRTANRPLPSGRISPPAVIGFIALTIFLGLGILFFINKQLLVLGLLAVISYNGLYTLWWKRHWAFAAVPGAVPGALPILMGFVAAYSSNHVSSDYTDMIQPAGLYLFFILFFWQMPHFWVLALRYQKDYAQGGFPTLPVKHGEGLTLHQIILWCLAYVGVAMIAPLFLPVGWIYMIPSFLMSVQVLRALRAFSKDPAGKQWLHFFLWVNLSLTIYLAAAVLDLWSLFLPIPHFTR